MNTSSDILDRIMDFKSLRSDNKLADILNVSPNTVSTWRKRNSTPFIKIIEFCDHEGISLDYILTGEGEMIREDKRGSLYNKVEDEDPEIAELLSRTMEILKSNTDYSASLSANIRSFHHAVKTENRLDTLEAEIKSVKNGIKKSNQIREEDPPGKKEDFIKRRAM